MLCSSALSRSTITGNWKSEVKRFGFVARNSAGLLPWAEIGIPLWNIDIKSSWATRLRYQVAEPRARKVSTFMRKYRVQQIGKIMQSEIAEIPAVFTKLISAESQFSALSDLLKSNEIHSVLVLARGTSDNAAHFLKYLIETQLGLPVGLTSPSSVTIYHANLSFKNTLVVLIFNF